VTAPRDPDDFAHRLQGLLEDFLGQQSTDLADLGSDAARLVEAARGAVSGGKRLRARFCAWGFRAVRVPTDADEEDALLRGAAALELLHASALVHDDLMDGSDTRRGRPSVHRAFADRHLADGWRGDPAGYGAAAAVLLGDLLLVWSDEVLRGCRVQEHRLRHALSTFDLTRSEVIAGQFLDVSVQARGDADIGQAMRVLRYKSAKYSVERPLLLGAALAGGSAEHAAALSAYGLPLGEAFQLRDDLLGVYGDPVVTGKPAGDDLSEGKRTVLVALALAGATRADAARLDEALGKPLSAEQVDELRDVIERSGAHAEVERRIEELTARSLAALDESDLADDARKALRDLAVAATQRTV
jgi:geranylgeranyl diphosphate synthase type I